ncbi:hypothetical protein ACLOJK_016128 [Asimina triloba]
MGRKMIVWEYMRAGNLNGSIPRGDIALHARRVDTDYYRVRHCVVSLSGGDAAPQLKRVPINAHRPNRMEISPKNIEETHLTSQRSPPYWNSEVMKPCCRGSAVKNNARVAPTKTPMVVYFSR